MQERIFIYLRKPTRFLFVIFIFSLIQLAFLLKISPTIIRGDGVGYYAYLRSIFFDHDMNFRNEYGYFEPLVTDESQPLTTSFLRQATPTGLVPNTWSVGPAILWSPFFLLGHLIAQGLHMIGQPIISDGYSYPYQVSIAIGSAVYGFIGLILVYRICRQYFPKRDCTFALFVIWFSTSLLAYMYFMPSMSHAVSFFAVALFIYLWNRSRGLNSPKRWAMLGIATGLMTLQRFQDILFTVIILVEIIPKLSSWKSYRKHEWLIAARNFFIFLGMDFIVFIPQIIAWRVIYGQFIINVQKATLNYGFDWHSPHILDVLFSSYHGLIMWTPVVALGLAGLYFLYKRDHVLAVSLATAFLLQLYLIGSWQDWHQGASFGGRMFVSSTPVFMIGLAALIDWLEQKRISWAWLLGGACVMVIWNYILLYQYGAGMISRTEPITWSSVFYNAFYLIPTTVVSKLLPHLPIILIILFAGLMLFVLIYLRTVNWKNKVDS